MAGRSTPWPNLSAFFGPIPDAARLAARHGSSEIARRIRARGDAKFFRALARSQIRAIRRRDDGGFYPGARGGTRILLAELARPAAAATEPDPAIEKPRHSEGGASDLMDHPSPDPRPGLISIASR